MFRFTVKLAAALALSLAAGLVVGIIALIFERNAGLPVGGTAAVLMLCAVYYAESFTGWLSRWADKVALARLERSLYSKEKWHVHNIKTDIRIFLKKKKAQSWQFAHQDLSVLISCSDHDPVLNCQLFEVRLFSDSLDAGYLDKLGELLQVEFPATAGIRYVSCVPAGK